MKPIKRGMTEAVTRDGRRVTQLTWFDVDDDQCSVVGVLDGLLHNWMENGRFLDATRDSKKDIFAPVEYEWQWIYKQSYTSGSYSYEVTGFFKSEHEMMEKYKANYRDSFKRIEESKREVK